MNTLLISLFLQIVAVPPRSTMENPAAQAEVPKNLRKDFDNAWTRFLTGKQDPRVYKDLDKILKKNKDFAPALTTMAYIDLFAGKTADARRKLEQVLTLNTQDRAALSMLADLTFDLRDYSRAGELYGKLLSVGSPRTDVEMRRQKALLLATEGLLTAASAAEQESRFADAEKSYRDALKLAPDEPTIHTSLGRVFVSQKKWNDAILHLRRALELRPTESGLSALIDALKLGGFAEEAQALSNRFGGAAGEEAAAASFIASSDDLENLGRWGKDIRYFQSIQTSESLTREQLAAIIVRYFPQIGEFPRNSRILTDVQDSWAVTEIQTVAGLGLVEGFPNHTFRPGAPVSRGDLAVSLARLSRLLGARGAQAAVPVSDVSAGHAFYHDIQLTVGRGLMHLDGSGRFRIDAAVPGKEALDAASQLLSTVR
jgi:tetratricopeptide (TPR) repeat protein